MDALSEDLKRLIFVFSLTSQLRFTDKLFYALGSDCDARARYIQRMWRTSFRLMSRTRFELCSQMSCVLDGVVDANEVYRAFLDIYYEEWTDGLTVRDIIILVATTLANLYECKDPFDEDTFPDFVDDDLRFFFTTVFKDNVFDKLNLCTSDDLHWNNLMCRTCFSISNGNDELNAFGYGSCCFSVFEKQLSVTAFSRGREDSTQTPL